MAVLQHPLTMPPSQLGALRSAMRDVQVSIGDYYRETARTDDPDALATRVRSCVGFIQVLNELIRKQSGANLTYRAMFDAPEDPRVGVIRAFEYARHLTQHVLHPVRPNTSALIGGLTVGMRIYAVWEDVPLAAHGRLKDPTKVLKPDYDQYLKAEEVTGTFLDAARFFFEVCPDLVHRDANGEWTGLPLRHQAGVPNRLHPEEPLDEAAAILWLAQRRPGGDRRVISGSLRSPDGEPITYGFTFVGRCSFTPFFETVEQVNADIANGYPYHLGDVAAHVTDRGADFKLSGRAAFCSDTDVEEWAGDPLDEVPESPESPAVAMFDWTMMCAQESSYLTRRERRLNASLPDY